MIPAAPYACEEIWVSGSTSRRRLDLPELHIASEMARVATQRSEGGTSLGHRPRWMLLARTDPEAQKRGHDHVHQGNEGTRRRYASLRQMRRCEFNEVYSTCKVPLTAQLGPLKRCTWRDNPDEQRVYSAQRCEFASPS